MIRASVVGHAEQREVVLVGEGVPSPHLALVAAQRFDVRVESQRRHRSPRVPCPISWTLRRSWQPPGLSVKISPMGRTKKTESGQQTPEPELSGRAARSHKGRVPRDLDARKLEAARSRLAEEALKSIGDATRLEALRSSYRSNQDPEGRAPSGPPLDDIYSLNLSQCYLLDGLLSLDLSLFVVSEIYSLAADHTEGSPVESCKRRIALARLLRAWAERDLARAVARLRDENVSWDAIGEMLEIPRSVAHYRYGRRRGDEDH